MKFRMIPLLLAAAVFFQSCLVEDMHATKSVFEVDDVTVPADSVSAYGKGSGTVKVSVPVRSTENWSAGVIDAETNSWLEIVSHDYVNPAGTESVSMLELECTDNCEYSPRSAQLRFVTAGGQTRDITVTQKAKIDRISVDGESSFTLEAETDESIAVKILCNAEWTAVPDPLSTCEVTSITPSSGSGDAIVSIKASPNYDCTGSRVAIVKFCVAGGNDAEVRIERRADIPFMGVNAVDATQDRMPEDTSGVLKFNCNSPWKAEVIECGIRDFKLEKIEGQGSMKTEVPFSMSPNDTDETHMAKVRFSLVSDPQKNVVLTVMHRAGFLVEVDFSNVADVESCPLQPVSQEFPQIPYTSSTGINTNGNQYDYKFSYGGKEYVLGIKNTMINVYTPGTADGYIRFNAGYVKLPAVEGYRLAYVEFTTAATNKAYHISSDADGLELVGNKQTVGKEVKVFWSLNATEYGKSYYEIIDTASSRQHNLILLYVK